MPRHAFLILFCVQLAVAVGNTGLLSVLPAIGRTLGIADFPSRRSSRCRP